jgi:long-chain fatty acid transport protein
MRRTREVWIAALCLAAVLPARALGAGYAIYEQGSAVLGMAGAGTASVHDPSALYFNPAKLTTLEGTQVYLGGNAITLLNSFAGVDPYPGFGVTEEMKPQTFFPPNVYVTHRFAERFALGAGLNVPYGLGIEWEDPETFTGRSIATDADLQGLNANLSAAYAFSPDFSLAAGFNVLFARVELQQVIQGQLLGGGGQVVDVARADLEADYQPDYGWNVAAWWRASEQVQLGAFYRSKVIVDVDGTVDFTPIPTGDPVSDAAYAANLIDQDVSSTLRFPAVWSAGIAWSPNPAWTFEGDFNFIEWSLFKDLPVDFKATPSRSRKVEEDYRDAWQVRFGAEHRLPRWTYRFGAYYDLAAAPVQSVTPLLPDAERVGLALGVGLPIGDAFTLDAYECGLFVRRRSTEGLERDNFNGVYRSYVNLAGAALTWRF